MDRIRMRGWDCINNLMVSEFSPLSDYDLEGEEPQHYWGYGLCKGELITYVCVRGEGDGSPKHLVEMETMLGVGIKDKTGTHIYTEDIVEYGRDELAVVEWYKGSFGLRGAISNAFTPLCELQEDVEVVGNVYEHDDLLVTAS